MEKNKCSCVNPLLTLYQFWQDRVTSKHSSWFYMQVCVGQAMGLRETSAALQWMCTFVQVSTVCTVRKSSPAVRACSHHTQLEQQRPWQFLLVLFTLILFSCAFYRFITSISHLDRGANYWTVSEPESYVESYFSLFNNVKMWSWRTLWVWHQSANLVSLSGYQIQKQIEISKNNQCPRTGIKYKKNPSFFVAVIHRVLF